MHKLMISIFAPFVVVALVFSASHAQPPKNLPGRSFEFGFGEHPEPTGNPELPVLRHDVENYYDAHTDRIMTYEEVEWEDGNSTAKIGTHRFELERQFAPQPLDVQPPPCTFVVDSAIITANGQTGDIHVDANVLCQMNGGLQSCGTLGFSLSIYKFQPTGLWTRVDYLPGQSPMPLLCNNRVKPWMNYNVAHLGAGTYRGKWDGWNMATNASLWSLTIQVDYAG